MADTGTASISTPNNTLYVSNIDWKIKKPLLKRALYMLFTRHGKVSRRLYLHNLPGISIMKVLWVVILGTPSHFNFSLHFLNVVVPFFSFALLKLIYLFFKYICASLCQFTL